MIESAPALVHISSKAALDALREVEGLTYTAIVHTDGRGTNQAPNAWFRAVAKVDPVRSLLMLAASIIREHRETGVADDDALHDVVKAVSSTADPVILADLSATTRVRVGSEHDAERHTKWRAAEFERMNSIALKEVAIQRLAADCSEGWGRYAEHGAMIIGALARQLGLNPPRSRRCHGPEVISGPSIDWRPSSHHTVQVRQPVFPANVRSHEILPAIRKLCSELPSGNRNEWDDVVSALGYILPELAASGQVAEVLLTLQYVARESQAWLLPRPHPLANLAGAFEACGLHDLASEAFALAYAWSRGEGVDLSMGGAESAELLERAVKLNRERALQVLAREIAYKVRAGSDNGISRHLVERIAELCDPAAAMCTWSAMVNVVRHRLPLPREGAFFGDLGARSLSEWSTDEALVANLLSLLGHPVLARRMVALTGVVRAISCRPAVLVRPLVWWLGRCEEITPVLLGLAALFVSEAPPFGISAGAETELRRIAGLLPWAPRRLATLLLRRAGKAVIDAVPAAPPPIPLAAMTDERRTGLLSADTGEVIRKLEGFWPDLGDRVARRLDHLITVEPAHKRRFSARLTIATGDERNVEPRADVLGWDVELFQIALNDELTALPQRLVLAGEPPASDDHALQLVVPDLRIHLGLEASRCLRPDWPFAKAVEEGIGNLPVLDDSDTRYEGWTRIAMFERQYYAESGREYERPTHVATLAIGAVAIPRKHPLVLAEPLGNAEAVLWFDTSSTVPLPDLAPIVGPVVGFAHIQDWLGSHDLLVPPDRLRRRAALRVPDVGAPLSWLDAEGVEAVVLRRWRLLGQRYGDVESYPVEGCDLIIRADLLQVLSMGSKFQLVELRRVIRRPLQLH